MCAAAAAVIADGIPDEPLRLSDILALADAPHPSISGAQLDYETAQVISGFHESANQLNLEAVLFPRRVDRAAPEADSSLSDGYAAVRLSHPLYDFGRRSTDRAVANLELERSSQQLEFARAQRRIEIMRRFFDVLLADLDYGVKDEKMTLAFLRYNRFLEEMEMHEAHAEVDVLALETIYREEFLIRQAASYSRMGARRNLGMALGFSDYVPRDLHTPDLSNYVEREVPEFEALLEQVLHNSHDMRQAELKLEQAEAAADVSESKYRPQLDLVLEATGWEEKTGSRNAASVGIQFRVPIAAGERRKRDLRLSRIAIDRARADLAQTEHEIRKRAFELWKALTLHHIDLNAAEVRIDYRDQYMDRARTLYELEERSDLGDAQAELLRALLEDYRVKFNLTLTWSEIDALTGAPVYPY